MRKRARRKRLDCRGNTWKVTGPNFCLSHSSGQIRSLTASFRVRGTLATHQCPVASCVCRTNKLSPRAKTHFHREKPSVLMLISFQGKNAVKFCWNSRDCSIRANLFSSCNAAIPPILFVFFFSSLFFIKGSQQRLLPAIVTTWKRSWLFTEYCAVGKKNKKRFLLFLFEQMDQPDLLKPERTVRHAWLENKV